MTTPHRTFKGPPLRPAIPHVDAPLNRTTERERDRFLREQLAKCFSEGLHAHGAKPQPHNYEKRFDWETVGFILLALGIIAGGAWAFWP